MVIVIMPGSGPAERGVGGGADELHLGLDGGVGELIR